MAESVAEIEQQVEDWGTFLQENVSQFHSIYTDLDMYKFLFLPPLHKSLKTLFFFVSVVQKGN